MAWNKHTEHRNHLFRDMTAADWLLVLLVDAFLVAHCISWSHTHLLWGDELFGFRAFERGTLAGVLRSWREGADGGGLLYYLVGYLWFRLFGLSAMTLRLFSSAAVIVAVAPMWAIARRYSSTLIASCAVGLTLFTVPVVIWQQVNGRFYGMFLASAALASLCFLEAFEADTVSPLLLTLTFLAHLFLIGSHILGLIYSLALILGSAVAEIALRRRLRWATYASAAAAWLLVPISYRAIRNTAAVAVHVFWTKKPGLLDFLCSFALFGRLTFALAMVLLVIGVARSVFSKADKPRSLDLPAWFLIGSLATADLITFAKSQFGISIYAPRYLLPMSIVVLLVFVVLLTRVIPINSQLPKSPEWHQFITGCLVLALCGAYAWSRRVNYKLYPSASYVQAVARALPKNEPVVVTYITAFMLFDHYDHDRQFLFVTDWAYDLDPNRANRDYSGIRLMENAKRAGLNPGQILPCRAIFEKWQDVTVLLDGSREDWMRDRFESNPDYSVHQLSTITGWFPLSVWSVRRVHPGPAPC